MLGLVWRMVVAWFLKSHANQGRLKEWRQRIMRRMKEEEDHRAKNLNNTFQFLLGTIDCMATRSCGATGDYRVLERDEKDCDALRLLTTV